MTKRVTVYLDAGVYRAVKTRATEVGRSLSGTVQDLLVKALAETPLAAETVREPFLVEEGPLLVFHGGAWPKNGSVGRHDLYD